LRWPASEPAETTPTAADVNHIIITVEGPNFQDLEEAEVQHLPEEGEAIETKYGTCIVTRVEADPAGEHYDGKVFCRLP
jgi:hypothetical protein